MSESNQPSIQEMLAKARTAQQGIENYSQAQIDELVRAVGKVVFDNAEELGIGLLGELASEIVNVITYLEESSPNAVNEETAFQLASAFLYIDQSIAGELVVDGGWRQALDGPQHTPFGTRLTTTVRKSTCY